MDGGFSIITFITDQLINDLVEFGFILCHMACELSRLQLTDVNLEEGFVLVHGKGAKDRYVPIGRSTIKCLWNYIKKRAVIDVNTNSYLFLTRTGTPLSARGVQIVFRSLKKKLNLDGRKLSPHLLRHSFALAYYREWW